MCWIPFDAPYVYQMAGFKFGATGNEDTTWAMNSWLPGEVVRRYRDARALSTSVRATYMRIFRLAKAQVQTKMRPSNRSVSMPNLDWEESGSRALGARSGHAAGRCSSFYATELRYGIIHDLAWKVWNGDPIDLTMGYVNQIWQGDANAYLCRLFPLWCANPPPAIINMTGLAVLSTRMLAEELGVLLSGTELCQLRSGGRSARRHASSGECIRSAWKWALNRCSSGPRTG